MKSALLSTFTILCASLILCSCHKEYTCVCTNTKGQENISKVKAARSSDATTSCKNHRSVFTDDKYTCEIMEED